MGVYTLTISLGYALAMNTLARSKANVITQGLIRDIEAHHNPNSASTRAANVNNNCSHVLGTKATAMLHCSGTRQTHLRILSSPTSVRNKTLLS